MKPRVVVTFSIFHKVIVSKMIYVDLFLHASREILDQIEMKSYELQQTGNLWRVVLRSPRFRLPLLQYG